MDNKYSTEEKKLLLQLVKDTISYGLKHHKTMPLELTKFPEPLREKRATFVTLQIVGQLRGCIGSLLAYQPLVLDLAHNAYAAAFSDPRFMPLTKQEFEQIEIHISILNEPEPMHFKDEQDLLRQLRPNIDGLILSEKGLHGTFLPSVWESLPNPKDFLEHLKLKAGLPANYWSDTIHIKRYTVESV